MASRRQKQFDRKYSSYRKYTATEDVNYSTHSSRSSYRSESLTSRQDGRSRSTSTEVVSGSESRSYPVYIAIQDYTPDSLEVESIALEQGQIVEVLDKKNSARWLVRTKARPPQSGWVPGSYFETPTEYYKQRRRTREIEGKDKMTEEQQTTMKRDQVYHDLLNSEEEFVANLRSCVDFYITALDSPDLPPDILAHREQLALNVSELYNFHANVLLKGLNYYSDDPGKVGQTFVRLEGDFEQHVHFFRELPQTLKLLEEPKIKDYFEARANTCEAGACSFAERLQQVADRMTQYQNFFKEFVKYASRAQHSSRSVQKALELVLSIPQRINELEYTKNIRDYPGDTSRLGKLIRHDVFKVDDGEGPKERYVFMFKNKLMITEKQQTDPVTYKHCATIRLDKYAVRTHTADEDILVLKPTDPGLPAFTMAPANLGESEYIRKGWLRDIAEEHEAYAAERAETETTTATEGFDSLTASDMRSEFSEYTGTSSRKSSLPFGPDEGGTPRKKIKSPPVISPTGSTTSIYSGGSSSIDWTTTGTTLEMQGTRVTRTQYGFRTLQESSAKMCLKVTGYPLPEITWYKDDVQLNEDERHTFYADEDGFFAMTIDPVQVEDTGRYTCMATNEYGQASTSAFFRVLKVEKEAAPPKFVNSLRDQECKEGEVCNFECEVEGWPEPELLWLVDDQPLRPSHDFKLQYDGQKAKLQIWDAQPDDTGVYTVKIQNEFGTAESKAELLVEPDPDKNHVAPEFQAVIEDIECREGDEVRFKAVYTGDPSPEITWLINGYPLSKSEKIKFVNEDGICILTIKDVTRHFDGIVTCQANNRLGSEQCTARLRVIVPPAPPTFNKQLEDKTVMEKNQVAFEVDVAGWPEPKVVFTLKGKELKHGEDGVEISGADGYFRVVINNCQQDVHEGEIVAKASNEHGSAESRARLTVEIPEEESRSAPTFLKDIEDQTVKEGEQAVFETTVSGSPNPDVTWYINGHKMDPTSPGCKIEVINHDHKLTIDSAQYAGTVLCRAENVVGRFETKARLIVVPMEKQKKPPRFVETLKDVTETEQNTVIFEVRVEGEPMPTVKWFLAGKELTSSDSRVEIREFDGSIKLELRNITLQDAGEIKAVATNSEGTAETFSKLTVKRKPFPPAFDKSPQSQTVEKGEWAEFSAHADGEPAPEYKWSVDGRKIRDSTEGAEIRVENGTAILRLHTSIFSSPSLTISVMAENSLGMDETGCRLIVSDEAERRRKEEDERKKKEEEARKRAEEEESKRKAEEEARKKAEEDSRRKAEEEDAERKRREAEEAARPKVTRELTTQTVSRCDLAHFEAVIVNAKTAKWYHSGKELTSSTHGVKISQDEKFEFRLSVDSSVFGEGEVKIVGENDLGSASSQADLKITEPMREFKKPEFTDKLKDMEIFRDEPFQMDVIALNSPIYQWFLNGKELKHGQDGIQIIQEENKCSLRFEKALPDFDKAQVRVTATNEVGTSECDAKLTLKHRPSAPVISDGPEDAKVKEGEAAEFKVKVTGTPEPTVKWYLNEKIVEESKTTVITRQGLEYKLRITETMTTETGKIRVVASNEAGTAEKTAELVVEKKATTPVFTAKLEEKTVNEGEQATWIVKIESPSPGTTLKWYINGKELTPKDGVEISDDGNGSHKLTVKASPDMDGTLTVKATNEAGTSEDSAKVTVNTSQKKPEITKMPQNHETTIDESVKFSAVVEGIPTPQISWFLNGKKLEDGPDAHVKHEPETGKTSVRIHKPKLEDSGKVNVVAENVHGKVEATAELQVTRKTEVPKFTTNMDDRQVDEGSTVKYTSTVEGYPLPTVEWTLNGEPVSKHPNVKISDDGINHTIEITDIQKAQEGELSCQATNSVGLKKQNVQLAVKIVGEAPTFAKNLQDLLVTEGDLTLMEAKLNVVKPKPKISWLKDGREFTTDDHWRLEEKEDGILILKIVSTDMADKCRITIKAENHFGAAECAASLGVVKKVPMAKPAFQSEIAPINIVEGDSLQTKLLITGNPTPFVKWYINGQMVCETEDTEISNANGVYSLTIHGCTADMTGKIKCTAYNKAGEVSTEGQLKVTKPIPVEFETRLCDATCREGDTLKLKAVLLGEPTPVVSWYVNGKKLEESQNIKIHAEKGTYTVTIKDITCDYSGKVICEAVNEYGKASSEAMLLVLPRGEPPDFLEWLSNVRARQGSKVVHKVVFTGDPKPTLTWYINNKKVTAGGDIQIVTDDKTSILTINNFNPDKHVGEIICKAENDAGEVSCTANMATYTSDMFSESESDAQLEEYGVDDAQATDDESLRDDLKTPVRTPTPVMAPKFITKIKDAKAKKGGEAIFECVVPDTKGVVCKWLKDGKEIELIARIRVQSRTVEGSNQIAHELTIYDVQPEDIGRYTVIVENSAGKDMCEANLTILETLEKPSQKAPEFTTKLQDKRVETTEKVVFECKVSGEPKPSVSWFHETIKIEGSSSVEIESIDEVQRLTINSAELKDKGKYSCVAENSAGSSKTEASLEVTEKATTTAISGRGPPEFIELLRSCTVTIGQTAVLRCRVKGEPRPKTKWTKEGKEVEMTTRIKTEYKEDGYISLTIENTEQKDAGEYKCHAENEHGSAWTEGPVVLTQVGAAPTEGEAPDFVQPVRPVVVDEGETAVLEGKISGKPTPTVKWYKNGEHLKESERVKIESLSDGTQRLTVKESKLSDTDEYRCEASNEFGDVWSDVTLTVKEKHLDAPEFVKELRAVAVVEGKKAEFECRVKVPIGAAKPDVKWFKDGEEIPTDARVHRESESDGTEKLVIEQSKVEDQGNYRVEISNPAGTNNSKAPLSVTPAETLKIKKGLEDQKVTKGTSILLSVEVEGKPKTVKWYRDNQQVTSSSSTKLEQVTDSVYRLEISSGQPTDAGSYRVVLSTESVSVESSCTVSVSEGAPLFKKRLTDQTVPKGTPMTLEVEIEGKPKSVKWYKGDKEIPGEDLGNGKYCLVVPNFDDKDVGKYCVVAENDDGKVDSSAKADLSAAKPEIVSGLVPTTVAQGETATFTVKVKGPVKAVKWYKNGKEIPDAKTGNPSEGVYTLTIPDAQKDDTADYKVVVSNDDGEADSAAALTVKLPKFEITKGLEDQSVEKGKKAVLELKTNSKPKTVKWYKNGKEIGPEGKAKPESDGLTHKLVVPETEDSDAADYKVVLTGDDDTPADSSCALTVRLPAEEPRIVKGLEDETLPVGSPLVLEVKTSGSPKTVKWFKNGQEVAAGKVNLKKVDDNNYVLEIPKSTLEDSGEYKVEVENEAGKASSSGKITVEPILTFIKPLKDQEVVEGENAEFKVETNAKPRTVKWYKNGQEIKPDSHFVISGDDKIFTLAIKGATRDDATEFKVVLSNSAGDADSSAKLTVKKAKPGAPKIVKGLDDQVVAKGAALVFEVKVEGEIDDVKWTKDGSPLAASANIQIEKIDPQTYRLTIPKADLADAVHYAVELANEGGKAKSDAKGEVDEKPEIVKGLEDTEVQEGDDDVLKVEVSAPVRTVKWYKNGQEIKPSGHMEPKKIGPKKYELAINKAQLDHGATYKVVLGNAAGECDSSAALTVTKPNILKILEGLKDVDVTEGQPLRLKIKVQGIPKTVKWYKNGQEVTPDNRVKTHDSLETGEFNLEIPSTVKADGAAYRVVLTNEKGEVYSGCVVHVKAAKPSTQDVAANFLTPLKDTEVEEGETLTLTCKVGGEPFPEIKWEKDGVQLEKSDRIAMRTALDGTVTLRIRDCKKSDLGQYIVTATNPAGSATSACAVTVKDKGEQPSRPHFVIPLSSCSAVVGTKKDFQVKVRGFPKPELKWTLNGNPLVPSDRVQIEDIGAGNYCLTIKDVQEEDYGTIRCVATNENGSDETSAEFDKSGERAPREQGDDRYPPRFNVPLWDRRIPVNDLMTIECHVDARPTAEIAWFKDGQPLVGTDRLEIRNSSDGACRVRIDRFTESDCGVYKCVAKNELGVADTQSIYSVEVLEEVEEVKRKAFAPKFNPGLEDRSVNAGQSLRLNCAVTAEPRAGVTWYKDGLPLRADGRITLEYTEDGQCSLSISEAKESDEGAYRCVATNEHGSINTSCLVTVKVPKTEIKKEGEEPFFTKNLVDVWTDRGDTFTLTCAVKGDPFPEIKWYRNGQLVRNGPRSVIETSPDGTCTLVVKECTMSDEGIYRCEAENKLGKAKTQATAHVQMALGKSDKVKVEEGQPPRFIIPLEDQTITLGSLIDLECKITGLPMPNVKWSKDGGPIWEDVRYDWDIDEAKGTYHLRIKSSTIADEGTYRCVATNESGSATTKAFVRIDDGAGAGAAGGKTSPPRFTIKLGDARATEGQPLKLECKIEGSPQPELTWHKDGAQIHPSDRIKLSLDADGTARLLIPQCTMDDEGIYRVIATNPSGSAHDKGNAIVKRLSRESPRRSAERELFDSNKAPKLLEPLENVKVPEKEGFKLRCKWSGDPKPNIKWFKDGERVFPYGRLQLVEHEDGVCELIVKESTRTDAGGYRCVAENSYGSARTTCDVTVIPKERKPRDIGAALATGKAPGFTIPLTIKRSKPGESVIFNCLPYGTPFPAIKWLKDGIELVGDEKYTMESLPDGTQKLTIKDVTFLSEGYFRCVATNEHGTASTKAELVVEGDRSLGARQPIDLTPKEPEESKPRIRRGLYNMSIHQGNVVEMIVCATGWPTPTVKWYKDGEEIISDGPDGKRVIFTDERGIHHLVILNVGPEDEGEYSLEATNKLGSARTEGALNIIRPRTVGGIDGEQDRGGMPFPPGFVRQLKNKHVFHHMPTIFDCLVVGHPAPEVEWFHNGKKIVPGGRIKIQSCGGGSHAIIILDTTTDDAGEYVAVAKNCHGTASSSAILDVTVPYLDNIKFNGEIDVTPYLTEEYGFKKINVASLPTPPDRGPFIKEVTGHYLTLSWIPTKRAPPRYPQVTYVIEIRELPEKEWTLLDYNIPEPVCKVRNLELGKSYQFRVRAENIYGISDPSPASPPSRLMAPPQPVLDKRTKKVIPLLDPYAERALDLAHAEQYACAPWFSPGVVEKRYCAENDTLTLILNVSGYPDPQIQWKFRGWDIDTTSPTSKHKVYTYGGTETTLTITGFTKENVGQYQCVATNPYGEAQQNIMVDLATRPSFIQPLQNKTFSSAHPMRLDVRVEGEPFPELKWMKEWRPIVESTRVKFVQDGPYLCSLIINDPMWRDSGIYSCVAVNDAGQATTSCTVTVEADGDYNDVELPKKRVTMEARKVREIYEIEEEDEKLAAGGAPFRVKERKTGKVFLAQLKPFDEAKRGLEIHNVLEHENAAQYRQTIHDSDLAVVVYEDVTGTILKNLLHPGVALAEPEGMDRERMVQIFMRQLLLPLEQMHGLRIAHLDLRPETILMQDGKLKLADFGQARRLLRGLITGTIRSNPEFVSPEVVRGYPLTLATDLWSVGTLAYILLTGISPFHGDNDNETLANVDKATISFDGPEWSGLSEDSRHFVAHLLKEIPADRMTCTEALDHRWLSEDKVKEAQLPADGLREFNYKFKWLERRVFVQQTPSEQLLQAILAPSTAIAKPQPQPPAEGAGALEVYDYLRIKPRSPAPVEDLPKRERKQGPVVPDNFSDIPLEWLPPGSLPPPPEYHPRDPRRRPDSSPDRFGPQGVSAQQLAQIPKDKIPLDQFGRLVRPEDLARIPHDSFGRPLDLDQNFPREDPRELQQLGPIQQIPPFRGAHQPQQQQQQPQRPPPPEYSMTEKRKLIPQEKGETPSKTRKETRRGEPEGSEGPEEMVQVPLRMIRGERRQIEEEIANRILSDISEEGSVAGSLASIDDLEPMLYEARQRAHSPSETIHANEDSSTPTASPVNTVKEGNFFPKLDNESLAGLPQHERDLLERAENDPDIPVGAPLFLEGLTNATLHVETAPLPSPAALSPKSPRRSAPGTKSPVLLSPGREHTMEALIAMKRGKPQFLAPGEKAPEIDDEDAHMDKRKQKVKPQTYDSGFKDLQEELDKKKKKVDLDDLEKYRPRNFYKEDVDFQRPGYDIDDSPWDSHYQIGPDTYLMASQGPSFNSRVRDYRRTLWGDGAPLVRQGFLGIRNQDITVRERRRYTDIMRETNSGLQPKQIDGSVMRASSASAIDRIKADIQNIAPSATKKNSDGTYAPIFISRLRDAYLGHSSAVFEISIAGSPTPKLQWQFQGKNIDGDDRRIIEQVGSISRLTIQNPTPYDLGEYSCLATNEFGTDKTTSRLVSGEAPSRPGRPECELSSDTELFITWQPPEGPTYLEGITYRLEYRPAGPTELSAPWVVISEHLDDEAVVVKHLEPMGVYQFRVTARNGVGLGVPSLSSRMVQTHGRGVPKLQVDILKDHYRLNTVTLPQKSSRQLNEISEESESEHGEVRASDENVELSNKDPSERFQIDALLCRGKFSVLRAAVDGQAEGSAQCVVKIRDSRDSDARREFNILKQAQHENVQRLVAAHDCGGFMYLFCERLYEDVFSRFSFNDYYTEEQVAMTARQLTAAIHWLHFRGVAHLDINPYNVMFQTKRNWIVKLVDFHSAQEISSAVKPTDINVLWAAPEMHVPEVAVSVQSDVWGMAVITFCLLGGFHPFYSEYDRPEEIKDNVLNVKCDPNLIPVTASQEALSFVTWGLKKSPLRRMRTDEALSHKFLSADPSMVRRREAAKYSASRLRKTINLTLPEPARPLSNELCHKFGEKNIQ